MMSMTGLDFLSWNTADSHPVIPRPLPPVATALNHSLILNVDRNVNPLLTNKTQ